MIDNFSHVICIPMYIGHLATNRPLLFDHSLVQQFEPVFNSSKLLNCPLLVHYWCINGTKGITCILKIIGSSSSVTMTFTMCGVWDRLKNTGINVLCPFSRSMLGI